MKIIAEKKVNPIVAGVALYLSFCAANLYFSRGNWALSLSGMAVVYKTVYLSNIFLAFFVGGIGPYILYELCTFLLFRSMRPRIGAVADDMKYELRFFYFAANCAVALLSLLYLISPLISIYGGILFPFICTAAFAALYIVYVFKHHVKKELWGFALVRLCGTYVGVYALITILQLFGVI